MEKVMAIRVYSRALLSALLAGTLTACNAERSEGNAIDQLSDRDLKVSTDAAGGEGSIAAAAPAPVAQMAEAPRPSAPMTTAFSLQNLDPAAMIIRTGTASLEVDSLELAISAVRALAARAGGHIANTFMQGGDDRVRQATLELKVPAARFDDALAALEPIGEVESIEVSAQDVGEEYVDVAARIEN